RGRNEQAHHVGGQKHQGREGAIGSKDQEYHHGQPRYCDLYIVKIAVITKPAAVKPNLYSVKIVIYKPRMAKRPIAPGPRVRPAPKRAASAERGRKRKPLRDFGSNPDAPYHHGALRDALLLAAERVLERDGLAGLTLRAVAREAGVSHAAPTHHFGDLTGL